MTVPMIPCVFHANLTAVPATIPDKPGEFCAALKKKAGMELAALERV